MQRCGRLRRVSATTSRAGSSRRVTLEIALGIAPPLVERTIAGWHLGAGALFPLRSPKWSAGPRLSLVFGGSDDEFQLAIVGEAMARRTLPRLSNNLYVGGAVGAGLGSYEIDPFGNAEPFHMRAIVLYVSPEIVYRFSYRGEHAILGYRALLGRALPYSFDGDESENPGDITIQSLLLFVSGEFSL